MSTPFGKSFESMSYDELRRIRAGCFRDGKRTVYQIPEDEFQSVFVPVNIRIVDMEFKEEEEKVGLTTMVNKRLSNVRDFIFPVTGKIVYNPVRNELMVHIEVTNRRDDVDIKHLEIHDTSSGFRSNLYVHVLTRGHSCTLSGRVLPGYVGLQTPILKFKCIQKSKVVWLP